ncbi:MAG TPA: ABC transporter substrate-binding protein, partial [Gaiellaceae bacterium]|nr:ABC transporter substrate-binding protein [Gaiellaceae bacterium]
CTEADITVGAAERLLSRSGLVGVLGPQCSAGARAAIPVYSAAGTIAISGSATTSRLTLDQPEEGFFFRTAFTNRFEGELTGQFVAEMGAKAVYLIDAAIGNIRTPAYDVDNLPWFPAPMRFNRLFPDRMDASNDEEQGSA